MRLTQRIISTLQTAPTEGSCYEIDARLRPGQPGTLVTSLDAFRRYHDPAPRSGSDRRCCAHDPRRATRRWAAFAALRLEILAREAPPDTLAEIHRVRQRMEVELARETSAQRNFKTGRGGVLDVECIVQALQLLHGHAHPALFDVAPTAVQLDRLAQLGLLSADTAGVLHEGLSFLVRLASRLRIVDNRSISDLDQERGDLEGIARRLGYTSPRREGGARRSLLADYERHTSAIRAEYVKVFQNV